MEYQGGRGLNHYFCEERIENTLLNGQIGKADQGSNPFKTQK